MSTEKKIFSFALTLILIVFVCVPTAWAGNKRLMSIMAAKMQASRALVESIYGLKIRATESVENMVAANYESVTESKTEAFISGIKYENIEYDSKKDIAKVAASVQLSSITNIDGDEMNLQNKVFRRVGYGTSTPANAGPLAALRVAEIDGYRELTRRLVGMNVESKTSVENYLLKSDIIKTKLLATLYLAEVVDYGWEETGDAFINMKLNVTEASTILGRDLGIDQESIEVQGVGAYEDDFAQVKK
ncbi:hypothetical protein [Desulfobacula toluolica]|uniref:Uncharacterized protein n=1 Tax=Desulfobacula toluolica (strain DSM 7467 / Tol2) TaxID=651182 RepID=K0NM19_DESTT|nr:hypothetical protein [Desulfobacula toluolica]CCK81053.1 uncharacterized protein TOL2_C28930 [Desulfobacula toluolica Tol2]